MPEKSPQRDFIPPTPETLETFRALVSEIYQHTHTGNIGGWRERSLPGDRKLFVLSTADLENYRDRKGIVAGVTLGEYLPQGYLVKEYKLFEDGAVRNKTELRIREDVKEPLEGFEARITVTSDVELRSFIEEELRKIAKSE